MRLRSRAEAQQRADQITAFRSELDVLAKEEVVSLQPEQQRAIERHHQHLLRQLTLGFDIDTTKGQQQFSLIMGIVSSLGAMALAASLFFFYFQYWGRLDTKMQVTVLQSMPVIGLVLTAVAARLEKSGSLAKLFALITLVGLVLDLSMLGQIFNIPATPQALLIWAVFALLLAYAAQTRFLLAMGILCLAGYLAAQTATWSGCYWLFLGERPETFFPAALLLFLASLIPHHWYAGFAALYRVFALLLFFLPLLVLCNYGRISLLAMEPASIEALYQVIGFVVAGLMIGLGIFFGWPETVNTANSFFTLLLYTKFYDWWWQSLPKEQFFFIIGLTALSMLAALSWLRSISIRRKIEAAL